MVAVGRQVGALEAVVAEVAGEGGAIDAVVADVTAADAPERVVRRAVDQFGGVDVLVNAAGVIGWGTIETTTDQAWDTIFDVRENGAEGGAQSFRDD